MARPRQTPPAKERKAKSRKGERKRWRQESNLATENRVSPPGEQDASGDGRDAVAPFPYQLLRNILANIVVARGDELLSVAIEDHFPIAQDKEAHGHFPTLPLGYRDHAIGRLVELMSRHGEGILKAVGHHEGAGLVDVALFHDEFDNRIRGYRIESAGRRVVKQYLRLGDDGPSDGDASPHATREFGRKHVVGSLQLYKAQHLANPPLDFLPGDSLFHQAESDVFIYFQRVGERAFLEHDAHAPAQFEQVLF